MDHAPALAIAEQCRAALAPFCARIEIAGSIRRGKPQVKDIELVAIPNLVPTGLFGDELVTDPDFCAVVNQWPAVKGTPEGRYTQRRLPEGIVLDLFMAHADNWGSILLIRTGDWEFSKYFMGTVLPRHGYQHHDGYVWRDGLKVPVREECELFALVGMPYIEPSQRGGPVGHIPNIWEECQHR
jgi:DNA polymerase/3'-5' exonuclease PolX